MEPGWAMAYIIRRFGYRQWLQEVGDGDRPIFTPFRAGAVAFALRTWAESIARELERRNSELKLLVVKV